MSSEKLNSRLAYGIKAARANLPNLSTEMIAEFLEVTPAEVRAMEDGSKRPSAEQLILLADLLNVKLGWFFDGDGV